MIDLYTWNTPNGRKVSILLEELGIAYNVFPVDIRRGEQFYSSFLKIAPNNRIPAIIDQETGAQMMESGAIMLYLSTKYDRLHCSGQEYWDMVEWLMWQVGGLGPILGQTHHFLKHNKGKSEYSEARFSDETLRLYGVLDRKLESRDFLVGEKKGEFTIADIACWPWVSRFEWHGIDLSAFPNVLNWYVRIALRPAVRAGYSVPHFTTEIPMP